MAEYEFVYTGDHPAHPVDEEFTTVIRDPDTMENINARIILRSSFEEHPGADRIFYTSAVGGRDHDAVPFEILEVIEEEDEEVEAKAHAKLPLGKRRGTMLFDMLKNKEKK